MISQQIMWTLLPRRTVDDGLLLSIYVAPRLRSDAARPTLSLFPNFLNWPTVVNGLRFEVEFKGGRTVAALPLPARPGLPGVPLPRPPSGPDHPQADQALWNLLFHPTTFVRPFTFKDQSQRIIRSFPVAGVLGYLEGHFRTLAENSPTELPANSTKKASQPRDTTVQDFLDDLGGIAFSDPQLFTRLDRLLQSQPLKALDLESGQLFGFASKAELSFSLADRFYNRPETKENYRPLPDPRSVPPSPKLPQIDFHQALTALGDYPFILRKLGLVIDLTIPDPGPSEVALRVIPHYGNGPDQAPSDFSQDLTPFTRCLIGKQSFLAEPLPGSDLQGGLLNLKNCGEDFSGQSNSLFNLFQVDPDGAALKTVNFSGQVSRLVDLAAHQQASFDTPESAPPPSLKTAGIGVARRNRALSLAQLLQDAAAHNHQVEGGHPEAVDLFADHILRGYRVDVLDVTANSPWRSLCLRDGRYRIVNEAGQPVSPVQVTDNQPVVQDEGYVKANSASSADNQDSDLYLHESLFRWEGWSLCAERPNQTIIPRSHTELEVVPAGPTLPGPPGIPTPGPVLPLPPVPRPPTFRPVIKQDEVVGRIPNQAVTEFKLETAIKATPGQLPRLRFGHLYRVRIRAVDLAGNSLDLAEAGDDLASNSLLYTRFEPVIAPAVVARAPFTEGESLEELVIRSNFKVSADEYALFLQSLPVANAALYAGRDDRHFAPPKTSQQMAETYGLFDEALGHGKDYRKFFNIASKEAGSFSDTSIVDVTTGQKTIVVSGVGVIPLAGGGKLIINSSANLTLPYLPDPAAKGGSFRDLPGLSDGPVAGLPTFNDPNGQFSALKVPFTLSDGQWFNALPFRLQIVERPGEMPEETQPEACAEVFSQPLPPQWDASNRVLTVFLGKGEIARVQYSSFLGPDDLPRMGLVKWLAGSNSAGLVAQYSEVGQAWQLTPFRELKLVHAVQQPLCPPRLSQLAATRDFGETRALLTGRFYLSVKSTGQLDMLAEWDEVSDDPAGPAPQVLPGKGHVFQLKIEETDQDHYELQDIQDIHHEFNDTKFRQLRYHLTATSRFREYFPPEITSLASNISRQGRTLNVIVPSTARPAAPKLEYIVPIFGWSEEVLPTGATQDWKEFKRVRKGGALRVYLGRPWFSSGAGELLGVILAPDPGAIAGPVQNLVTQMGADPAWFSAQPKFAAGPQDFTNVTTNENRLTLDEAPDQVVNVVAFKPDFDPSRRLWYSDIQFAAPFNASYNPFVRLALARYQANSLTQFGRDVKLSRVIIADFMQLLPDRELTLNLDDDEKTLVVSLSGFAPQKPLPNLVEISLETHDPQIPGEFGWHSTPSPAGTASDTNNPFRLTVTALVGQDFHFSIKQTLTLPVSRGSQPFRVVVKEFEEFVPDPLLNLTSTNPITSNDFTSGHVKRLIYADTVEL